MKDNKAKSQARQKQINANPKNTPRPSKSVGQGQQPHNGGSRGQSGQPPRGR